MFDLTQIGFRRMREVMELPLYCTDLRDTIAVAKLLVAGFDALVKHQRGIDEQVLRRNQNEDILPRILAEVAEQRRKLAPLLELQVVRP